MTFIDIIRKKRDGFALSKEEIEFFISQINSNSIPDYQVSALLMTIFFRGMNFEETSYLTEYMVKSGIKVTFENLNLLTCDKHSTGGVGDKISIPLAPIVSSCGVAVPMMSGRGLGHTGGTLDKLESIPGFNVNLTLEEYKNQVKELNVALIGQTKEIAVADKYLYALRDATCTVESIPLITASIMSKKIAEGTKNLVIDLKVGKGAFMKDLDSAQNLAQYLIKVGNLNGVKTCAVLTNMDQPIGKMIGNSLEIIESIELLKGNIYDGDFFELTIYLSSLMISKTLSLSFEKAKEMVLDSINSKKAINKFKQIIIRQKGNPDIIDDYSILPIAKIKKIVYAKDIFGNFDQKYVEDIDAFQFGLFANSLGAGRLKKEDSIDHGAGIELFIKVGDLIKPSHKLLCLYSNKENSIEEVFSKLKDAIKLTDKKIEPKEIILKMIDNI
ncbi:MAG TPA: thymidine phosphorylase [Exilispira sp.]|nr:thymidine phosphorylase [Exilispira sp.]